MTITLIIGNVGSGKTLFATYLMLEGGNNLPIYSNIRTKGIPHNHLMNRKMIVKETTDDKGKVIKKELNVDFWKKAIQKHNGLNVYIDEAHEIFNSRTPFSSKYQLSFLALIRKVLGGKDKKSGDLVLISQLSRRLDVICREMSNRILYVLNHYVLYCTRCNYEQKFTNLHPEIPFDCPKCQKKNLQKKQNYIEVFHFTGIEQFEMFTNFGKKTYYRRSRLDNIEKYYKYYDTFQFDSYLLD